MPPSSSSTLMPPEAAVLLVLVPLLPPDEVSPGTLSQASIRALQGRLGPAIRVLKIDEANYPDVVRSFGTPGLPACVLVRQGVELWRQQGLPDDESAVCELLEAARTWQPAHG
ncbi:thioredoxin [Hymenobacter sp. BT175]|uniref:thioredoxin n=1 Tax=Hymenobacter translucens TaxID=2886507 RepID=UPI001D0DD3CB|nr:thioredoxin [Hymenobacter translucens]MCC2547794.1 thioredoxin [Hymenobacter translucens]